MLHGQVGLAASCALNIRQFDMLRQSTVENWSILNIKWRKIPISLIDPCRGSKWKGGAAHPFAFYPTG